MEQEFTVMTRWNRAFTTAVPKALGGFVRDHAGTTAIEYAVIAAGISIAIVATVEGIGSEVVGLFSTVAGLF